MGIDTLTMTWQAPVTVSASIDRIRADVLSIHDVGAALVQCAVGRDVSIRLLSPDGTSRLVDGATLTDLVIDDVVELTRLADVRRVAALSTVPSALPDASPEAILDARDTRRTARGEPDDDMTVLRAPAPTRAPAGYDDATIVKPLSLVPSPDDSSGSDGAPAPGRLGLVDDATIIKPLSLVAPPDDSSDSLDVPAPGALGPVDYDDATVVRPLSFVAPPGLPAPGRRDSDGRTPGDPLPGDRPTPADHLGSSPLPPSGVPLAPGPEVPGHPGRHHPPAPPGADAWPPAPWPTTHPQPARHAPFAAQTAADRHVVIRDADSTTSYPVRDALYVGRSPAAPTGAPLTARGLAVVRSPTGSVSGTHLRLRTAHGQVFARDLWSMNGTTVVPPTGTPFRLGSGEELPVMDGTLLELGDGVVVTVLGTSLENTHGS